MSTSTRRWTLLGYPGLGPLASLLARQPLKGQWKNHDVLKKESGISALPSIFGDKCPDQRQENHESDFLKFCPCSESSPTLGTVLSLLQCEESHQRTLKAPESKPESSALVTGKSKGSKNKKQQLTPEDKHKLVCTHKNGGIPWRHAGTLLAPHKIFKLDKKHSSLENHTTQSQPKLKIKVIILLLIQEK